MWNDMKFGQFRKAFDLYRQTSIKPKIPLPIIRQFG